MSSAFAPGEVLRLLPAATAPLVEAVLARAKPRRLSVYLVGGPVRDLLLARPIRDVDLVVESRGEWDAGRLAEEAAPEGAKTTLHRRFGTATVLLGDARIDLAMPRREVYAHPGALPSVAPASLEEDMQRRDFSVNALALPLNGVSRGARAEVLDWVGGCDDLESGALRILHPQSFHDDPTRALRAARLAPRLGLALTRPSRTRLRDALRDGAFGSVSGERLRRELDRCFSDARLGLRPVDALRRLADWHVLGALEPGLALPAEAVAPLRRLGRSLQEAPWRGPRVRPGAAGMAVWLASLPAALRRRALDRFSIRGDAAQRILAFPRARDGWLRSLAKARGRGPVDAQLAGIDEEQLYALHAWAPALVRRRIVRWAAEDRSRRVPLSGSDLVDLGLSGAAAGKALSRVRAGYLDGELANREEALALARELAAR